MTVTVAAGGTATISRDVVQTLLDILAAKNYEVVGPTVRDDAIVYDRIARLADLPAGWTDHQEAGRYRLERRDNGALFGFTVGPQAWKRFLHRPVETLWTMRRTENGVTVESGNSVVPKFAFIGVRACELHAIAIQDRVLSQGPYPDLAYAMRRLGIRCELADWAGGLAPEQVTLLRPTDAMLAISFTPYAQATVDLTTAAFRRGIKVVAITDSPFSPLIQAATVWLEVAEADHLGFRSLAGSFALATTLAVGVARERSAEQNKNSILT